MKHYGLTVFQARNRVACGMSKYFTDGSRWSYSVCADGNLNVYFYSIYASKISKEDGNLYMYSNKWFLTDTLTR